MPSRRAYRIIIVALAVPVFALALVDAWMLVQRRKYHDEIERLAQSMTALERERARQIVTHERNKVTLAIELLRRQAQREPNLHLSVNIDSGTMYLQRDGAVLREMPILIGPERRVGLPPDTVRLATPRGARTVAQVLVSGDSWIAPAWVYADRAMPEPPPDSLSIRSGLGPVALLMDGGTLIYSLPVAGPLSDSTYVLPGAVRARAEDLQAILPNLKSGLRVYFY
jgi:hypothetical protein